MEKFNENIGQVLGQKVGYSATYSPDILVRELRSRNREKYGIEDDKLRFVGWDNWNCYEISFLLDNGYPVSGIARIVYSAANRYLVESKSLKLYLNSFNMEKMGETPAVAEGKFLATVKADLSKLLETDVQVSFFSHTEEPRLDWKAFENINNLIDFSKLEVTHYTEAPEVLRGEKQESILRVCIPFLRSNCKITHQPDWGTAFIYYKGPWKIDLGSLAQYIISFRNENHFHEEVCEMIYTRLFEAFTPEELGVACCYTRRGGIDINPVRATDISLIPEDLRDSTFFLPKLLQQ